MQVLFTCGRNVSQCSSVQMVSQNELTVRDSHVADGAPLAPKAVVWFAAHLHHVDLPRVQAEDVELFLLTGKVFLQK